MRMQKTITVARACKKKVVEVSLIYGRTGYHNKLKFGL